MMEIWDGKKYEYKRPDGKIVTIGTFLKREKGGYTLLMHRDSMVHELKMYGGSYGIAKEKLAELVASFMVAEMKLVIDKGKEVLITTPSNWRERGIEHKEEGWEEQIHLLKEDFDKWYH